MHPGGMICLLVELPGHDQERFCGVFNYDARLGAFRLVRQCCRDDHRPSA